MANSCHGVTSPAATLADWGADFADFATSLGCAFGAPRESSVAANARAHPRATSSSTGRYRHVHRFEHRIEVRKPDLPLPREKLVDGRLGDGVTIRARFLPEFMARERSPFHLGEDCAPQDASFRSYDVPTTVANDSSTRSLLFRNVGGIDRPTHVRSEFL